MSALDIAATVARLVAGMALHLALCGALVAFGAGLPGLFAGWLAGAPSTGTPLLQPWRAWRALIRKRPARAEAGGALTLPGLLGSVVLAATAVVLTPGFVRLWPSGATGFLVLVGLLLGSRLIAWLPALGPGMAGEALAAEAAVSRLLRDWALGAMVAFAVSQMAGGTQADALGGLMRSGPDVPATLPIALVCAVVATALLATAEWAGPYAWERQLSGPDLALSRVGRALRCLGWLMMLALLLPPAPPDASAPLAWPVAIGVWLAKLGIGLLTVTLAAIPARDWLVGRSRRQEACLLFASLSALLIFAAGRLA